MHTLHPDICHGSFANFYVGPRWRLSTVVYHPNLCVPQNTHFCRARLPSLYSDFQLQRTSNPDGFEANYTTWIETLSKAAWTGLLPAHGPNRTILSLEVGNDLLQALETKEYGRPLALGTVVVGTQCL